LQIAGVENAQVDLYYSKGQVVSLIHFFLQSSPPSLYSLTLVSIKNSSIRLIHPWLSCSYTGSESQRGSDSDFFRARRNLSGESRPHSRVQLVGHDDPLAGTCSISLPNVHPVSVDASLGTSRYRRRVAGRCSCRRLALCRRSRLRLSRRLQPSSECS
jgi:hypothetical protein